MSRRSWWHTGLLALAGIVLAVVILVPFAFAISASFQTETQLIERPPPLVPPTPTVDNYRYVFTGAVPEAYKQRALLRGSVTQEARVLPKGLRNSSLVALGVVFVNLVFGTLASYTFARQRFRGKQAAFGFILASRLLPTMAVAIPIYEILRQLGLLDSKLGLTVIYSAFTLPFTIWVLTLYFRSLPPEMEEAARVDGCTRFGAFRRILLPLIAPGLVATSIFAFIQAWNEYVLAYVLLSSPEKQTLTVWLASFTTVRGTDWGPLMAAATLTALPVVVFFLIVQRRVAFGLTAGAVKG
jgi:N,N'-diacetylchitobiose transport system permease protein